MSQKTLFIIRGISGSGKSTLARLMIERSGSPIPHFEADQYFMFNGHYNFVPSKLGQAHQWCKESVRTALRTNETVIVSNTFTTKKELFEYLDFLKSEPYTSSLTISIREPETEWKSRADIAHEKNTHGVPRHVVENQLNRWYEFPVGDYQYNDLMKELEK